MKSTKEGLINNISKNIRYKDIYLNPNNCKVNPITTQQ